MKILPAKFLISLSIFYFRPRSLFEGLENISEDEQLARLLALSEEEAAVAAAVHEDRPAVGNNTRHSPIPASSAVSIVDIAPPPPQKSQSQVLQEQFDLWKRIPVGERESLVLNEDFDPDKLVDIGHNDNGPVSNHQDNEEQFYTGKFIAMVNRVS
jgi:hypothetical protein